MSPTSKQRRVAASPRRPPAESLALGAFRGLVKARVAQGVRSFPDLSLHIVVTFGDPSEFPEDRNYAYSAWDGETASIVFAPKVLEAPQEQRDALLRHELSHAFLQHAGLPHSERDCDAVAERIFGAPIYYDHRDVQTLNPRAPGARRPRPAYLPTGDE